MEEPSAAHVGHSRVSDDRDASSGQPFPRPAQSQPDEDRQHGAHQRGRQEHPAEPRRLAELEDPGEVPGETVVELLQDVPEGHSGGEGEQQPEEERVRHCGYLVLSVGDLVLMGNQI